MQAEVQNVTPEYLEFFFFLTSFRCSAALCLTPPFFFIYTLDKATIFSQIYVMIRIFHHDI